MAVRVLFKVGAEGPGHVDIGQRRYSLPAGSQKAVTFADPVTDVTIQQYSQKSTNLSYEVVPEVEPDPSPDLQIQVTNLRTGALEAPIG